MELCILIPAKNEEVTLSETVTILQETLSSKIKFNILVVDDYSEDGTLELLANLTEQYSNLSYVSNTSSRGVGNAIKFGLSIWKGDVIAVCMADGSDAPEDILKSYYMIDQDGYDCVFGSRFIKGGGTDEYPLLKLVLNRIFNGAVKFIFGFKYNDFTNIFKVYHRRAIVSIGPILSGGFSIGLEMSVKVLKQKLNVKIIPITWKQRTAGVSKLKLSKNIRHYTSTLIYLLRYESQQ
ncbi:MAG: dolichol-phosphate mannosyltransferase [Arcticibacterium sp.]|jgi:dolichol-phosphate mannosyltransferase